MAKNLRAGLRQSIKASRKASLSGGNVFGSSPLDLRFALQKTLDPRVTFTRASTGTYVGSNGVIQSAVTNLLLRSEEFNDASWMKNSNPTVTVNQIAAPNGSITADKLTGSGSATGYLEQVVSIVSGQSYVFSIYLKKDTTSTCSTLLYGSQFNSGGSNQTATWNFDTGLASFTNGASGSMTPVGNNWFRCVMITTATTTNASSPNQWVRLVGNSGNVFLWGAQLEQASAVGEYIPTTNAINSNPRFDHNPTTGESLGLLVEEARTNLLLNSATLSTQSVTVAAAANTLSFYGTGTVTLTGVSTAGPLVGTGANNRVSLTFTPTAGVLILTVSGSVTNAQLEAGAFPTSYIPTTTATVTRAADVASITGSNFSSWYNQTEGTVFAEVAVAQPNTGGNQFVFRTSDNTYNNAVAINIPGQAQLSTASSGTFDGSANSVANLVANVSAKISAAYATNNLGISLNGATAITDTSATMPTGLNRADIGSDHAGFNRVKAGTIKRLTYWPVRLADPTLVSITQP